MKNITKRLLGVLLTVAMIAGLVTVPAFAYKMDPNDALITVAETYFTLDASDDAATFKTGNPQTKIGVNDKTQWYLVSNNGAGHNITDGVFTLKGTGNNTTACSTVFQTGTPIQGDTIYEFEFKQDTVGDVGVLFSARYCAADTIHNPTLKITNGKIAGNGSQEGDPPTLPSGTVTAGTWHKIKVAYHITRGTAGTYDVYMDDVLVLKDRICADGNRAWTDTDTRLINRIQFQSATVDTQYRNLKIWREPVGVTTVGADDFDGYTAEKTYTANVADTFIGLPLHKTAEYPYGVTIRDGKAYVAPASSTPRFFTTLMPGYVNRQHLMAEFDFIPASAEKHGDIFRITDKNASNHGAVIVAENGKIYAKTTADDGSYTTYVFANYTAEDIEKTFNFKLFIDLSKTFTHPTYGTLHGFYDIYLNDKCVAKDLKISYANATDMAQFGRAMTWSTNHGQSGTNLVFDKIVLREDVREKVLSDAITTLYAAYPDKTLKAGTINLPTSTVDGYTITWTSSDSDAVDTTTGKVGALDVSEAVILTATVKDTNNEYSISRKYDFTVLGGVTASAAHSGNYVEGKVYNAGLLSTIDPNAMVVVGIYYKDSGKLRAGKIGTVDGDYLKASFDISEFAEGDYVVKTYVFGNVEDGMKPIVETPAVEEFTFTKAAE